MANETVFERNNVALRDELVSALRSRDWNFHDSTTENDGHNIHPFPAKFIAQIPRTIFSIIPVAPGTAVLDPFCGSGTTLLEAKNAGLDFVGVDLNPIAVLISRVKTDGVPPDGVDALDSALQRARSMYVSGAFIIPEIPNLNHWFRPGVAQAMACLTDSIRNAPCSEEAHNFLRLSLSAITVRVSNQESETRYAALENDFQAEDVFELFKKTGQAIASKLQKSSANLFTPRTATGKVINADAREIGNLEMPPISLVITSPPYPNAFEYWLYNKYRMYWLGYDPIGVRQLEIGARPHYVSAKGDTVHDFSEQMATAFQGISRHLVSGATIAIVVSSDCRIRGEVFAVPDSLEAALRKIGYESLTKLRRTIPRTRKAFNPEIGSIESETLLFMSWREAQ